jgi:nitroreductase
MADLLREIDVRRARRAFSGEKVQDSIIARLMTAATFAPSCFNNQPWRFMMITGEEPRKRPLCWLWWRPNLPSMPD